LATDSARPEAAIGETVLAGLERDFGAKNLRLLRELLPPAPVRHQDFLVAEYDELFEAFVEGALVEFVDPVSTIPARRLVRLTELGRQAASAIRPAVVDYAVERGGGRVTHACEVCGDLPSMRSVRVERPGIGSNRLMDIHYFCEAHGIAAETCYRGLCELYVTELAITAA